MIDFYEIVFWVTGIFGLYAWYILISAFSQKKEKPKKKVLIVLGVYYFVSNAMHYIVEIPVLNILMTTTLLTILAMLLNLNKRKMLLSVLYAMLVIIFVDIVVVMATGSVIESIVEQTEYHSEFGRIMSIILTYAIGVGVHRFKNINKDTEIPMSYWLTLAIFPIFSIAILLIVLKFSTFGSESVIVSSTMILIMNIIVFSLFDQLLSLYHKRIEDLALGYLNDSYKKQLELMKASVINVRTIHHDMRRHMSSINTLIKSQKFVEADQYTHEIEAQFSTGEWYASTGNTIIDSIINFELSVSEIDHRRFKLEALYVPVQLSISDFDLTIVLSNLLRNALQAAAEVPDSLVQLEMDYRKGAFYIKLKNNFKGELKVVDGKYISKHSQNDARGFGIQNVKNVIHKYNGELQIQTSEDTFYVDVIMFT